MATIAQNILIGPVSQLLTLANLPLKGALKDEDLEIISDAGIVISGEEIVAVGKYQELANQYPQDHCDRLILSDSTIMIPGLVDAHTHICFGGSRAKDFAMRNAGKSYLDIAKSGGGIWDTVQQTRKASQNELTALTLQRIQKQIKNGITTCEIKSGYGLSVEEELKMLRSIKAAKTESQIDIVPTCLAAHIFPKDYDGSITDYLDEIASKLFPVMKEESLGHRIDAFIEEEAYSKTVVKSYFEKAKQAGFDITVHADQFSCSGSEVAIEHGALSADHLEASGQKEILALADSDVIAMALPGASIGIGCKFTPGRKLLDAGALLAIASDWNPGSAPMGDLLTQASIIATFEKLSTAEVLAAITYRAAAALNMYDRGRLIPGMKADFVCFFTNDHRDILYHQGQLRPSMVYASGKEIYNVNR